MGVANGLEISELFDCVEVGSFLVSQARVDMSSYVTCSKSSNQSSDEDRSCAATLCRRLFAKNPPLNCLPRVRVKVRDGLGSGSVELRPNEPRRLRASFDCSRFLDEDVGPQTSPSDMDLLRKGGKQRLEDVTFDWVEALIRRVTGVYSSWFTSVKKNSR